MTEGIVNLPRDQNEHSSKENCGFCFIHVEFNDQA